MEVPTELSICDMPVEIINIIVDNVSSDINTLNNLQKVNKLLYNVTSDIKQLSSHRQIIVNVENLVKYSKLQQVNRSFLIKIQSISEIKILAKSVPNLKRANFFIESDLIDSITQIVTSYQDFENFGFFGKMVDAPVSVILEPITKKACFSKSSIVMPLVYKLLGNTPVISIITKYYIYWYGDMISWIPEDHIIYPNEKPVWIKDRMFNFLNSINLIDILGNPINMIETRVGDPLTLYRIIKKYLKSKKINIEHEFYIPTEMAQILDLMDREYHKEDIYFIVSINTSDIYQLNNKYDEILYIYQPENIEKIITDFTLLSRVDQPEHIE